MPESRRGPPQTAIERHSTVDADQVARFSALADEWWDPGGSFRPLHKLNPVRLEFIRDRLAAHHGRDPLAPAPLAGLEILDVGCGGGLICEPLCRLGAAVTGIDASDKNVGVAGNHAGRAGLDIDYRHGAAEDLAGEGRSFDAVLSLEVVEHVADIGAFVAACCALVRPGGMAVFATLNRTAKSFAFAVVGAEYVLRWLPRGTHDWRRFVRPSELARHIRDGGARVAEVTGVGYDIMTDQWRLVGDVSVNYMVVAEKDG
jgi:2-polyprenyl-6-hydroxyphenyl methylase/3-demethylubiquinone-9 3-methyltransferase